MGAIHATGFTEQLYKRAPGKFYVRDSKVEYSKDETEREYILGDKKSDAEIRFRARPLPGCCGVLVVYYLRPSGFKNQTKAFNEALSLIIDAAGKAKFGNVLLTQTVGSLGYQTLNDGIGKFLFTNWKTNNQIGVFQFETKAPEAVKKVVGFEGE
jgi:branched-subunit amino acid transport protein AzlD